MTGAGASAESGIPTFRGDGGFWGDYRPEELATPEGFEQRPKLVWEWYMWRRELVAAAIPNPGHYALAALEATVPRFTLITQNVDGLHQRAGSRSVIELHGNILKSRCHCCGVPRGSQALDDEGQLPCCDCGGLIRPDVVWFGELLPAEALQLAGDAVMSADVFMSIGTSSLVHPAAGLSELASQNGAYTVEINPERTEMSELFDEVLRGPSGEILPMLCQDAGINIPRTMSTGS